MKTNKEVLHAHLDVTQAWRDLEVP